MSSMAAPRKATAPGKKGLTRVATYERLVHASTERVWENVRDWEHLPWLHHGSFSRIECLDAGSWGWRARIGLRPLDSGREVLLELVIETDTPRYVSRTLEGEGAGSEIWTDVEERGAHRSQVRVEFWLPDVAPEEREPLGDAFTRLYTRLWDEDEKMMIRREGELGRRRGTATPTAERLGLGLRSDVEARLPLVARFGGHSIRIVLLDGALCAHATVCPHRLGPLEDTAVEDGRVMCPWHGYTFDVRTGQECTGRGLKLRSAPRVEIDPENDEVWLVA